MSYLKHTIALFLFVGIAGFTSAQNPNPTFPIDSTTKLITYTEIVNSNLKKEDLYKKAIGWLSEVFTNPTEATNVRDDRNFVIEGGYRFKYYNINKAGEKFEAGMMQYKFKLEMKDGKYRYTFTKFNVKGASYTPIEKWLNTNAQSYKPQYDSYLQQMDDYIKGMILKLKKAMSKSDVQKKDNF